MANSYQNLLNLYNRRQKGRDYKALHETLKKHNGGFDLVEASNDSSNKAAA